MDVVSVAGNGTGFDSGFPLRHGTPTATQEPTSSVRDVTEGRSTGRNSLGKSWGAGFSAATANTPGTFKDKSE
jgi:hypothetical protein